MARGGGGGFKGGFGSIGKGSSKGGLNVAGSSRSARGAKGAARAITRNAGPKAKAPAGSHKATREQRKQAFNNKVKDTAGQLPSRLRGRVQKVADKIRNNRDWSKSGKQRTANDVKREARKIACDDMRNTFDEMTKIPIDGEDSPYTSSGIYNRLGSGQRSLLAQAQPEVEAEGRASGIRSRMIQRGFAAHPNMEEAVGQSIVDIVDQFQNIYHQVKSLANELDDN